MNPTTTETQPDISVTVGQKVKQTWPNDVASDGRRYVDIPDNELGAKYILKHGDQGLTALGIQKPDVVYNRQQATKAKGYTNLSKDLDLFEKNYKEAGLKGKVLGFVPSGTGLSPESADFDAQKGILAYSIAKSIGDQTGQSISDKDIKNFKTMLPSRTDTDTEAANKMNNIRTMLATRLGGDATQTSIEKGGTVLDAIKSFGEFAMGTAKRTVQDIAAGAIANMTDDTRKKAATEGFATAKSLEDQAANEVDPQKKKLLLQQAQSIYTGISDNAKSVSSTFSKDVNADPVLRALGSATQVVGAADVIANPSIITNTIKAPFQAIRHPVETVKNVANVVKDPIGAAKEFIKNDIANSGYKGTGLGSKPIVVDNPAPVTSAANKPITTAEETLAKPATISEKPIAKQLTHSVRQIDLPPSIYGHGKEEAVNATLDKLGFQGDGAQQYAMLKPKMEELSNSIEQAMIANPKKVMLDDVVKDFDTNLTQEGIYRTSQISRDVAQKEAKGYIKDLFNSAKPTAGNISPTEISDLDFFKLKQMVNKDYKSVAQKIMSGQSLSEREKVIQVARQTFDDIISNLHPDVKELTTMQSHLYDAVDSLYKARNAKGVKIGMPSIPGNFIQKTKDVIGRALMPDMTK